jgi:glycosyltransferase involved in cell wall biosynthesis
LQLGTEDEHVLPAGRCSHEGFGLQLAEAMATGTTCISSGRGVLLEVGDSLTINFEKLEPAHIANKIVQCYREELHLRDNIAQVEYTKRFSWDDVGALVTHKLAE